MWIWMSQEGGASFDLAIAIDRVAHFRKNVVFGSGVLRYGRLCAVPPCTTNRARKKNSPSESRRRGSPLCTCGWGACT